ncbi:MAG: hypothetical protein HC945_04275, partial [Nitrosarchaeum sp.]|nr:hypothetical protein [Nitrosarchaeum sp.]
MHRRNILLALVGLASILALTVFVSGNDPEPVSPQTFNEISQSTFNDGNYPDQSHEAIAGNITELYIFGVT